MAMGSRVPGRPRRTRVGVYIEDAHPADNAGRGIAVMAVC
jgi:hypothetical protein